MSSLNIEVNSKNTINSKILDLKKDSISQSSNSKLSQKELNEDSDNLSDASFSFSKPSDVDSLYDNISNKSKDNIKYVYESTLKTIENDFNKEIDLQFEKMSQNEPGFEQNIKIMSSDFYKKIMNSIIGEKQNQPNLDKTNNAYTSISGVDDQTSKLKNDLSGVPIMIGQDVSNITGNIERSDKKKCSENNENEFLLKDSKLSKESSEPNGKNKLDYKKTMSLEFSKEKDSCKKEMISSSSQNKQSTNKKV